MLVQHVEAVVSRGPSVAAAVLEAVVDFSLRRFNHWLKVAADLKGGLLDCALGHARRVRAAGPHGDSCARLELGAFVGYSGIRLSGALQGIEPGPRACRVMSLEVEPLHVCVARHLLNFAERAAAAEVRTGQARDLVPLLAGELGELGLDLVFMDHRGTRFHEELRAMECQRALCPSMVTVCDNVLHPGAPVFLWEEARPNPVRRATVWSLPEFGGDGCIEDWMAFLRYEPRRLGEPCSCPSFTVDVQDRRAAQLSSGESGSGEP